LISEGETVYGVVSISRAREIALELELDLVEISPNANPPVVKLIDYGKYKYQLQKKVSDAKKKQIKISVKEIKFRPAIDTHDLEVKLKNIKRFLEDGDKVKLLMQFRGREMAHKELGLGKFSEIVTKIQNDFGAVVESPLKMMGNRAFCMMAPSKKI
jgi:translation initiation factor IF-3